jgi:hypothetical protein
MLIKLSFSYGGDVCMASPKFQRYARLLTQLIREKRDPWLASIA